MKMNDQMTRWIALGKAVESWEREALDVPEHAILVAIEERAVELYDAVEVLRRAATNDTVYPVLEDGLIEYRILKGKWRQPIGANQPVLIVKDTGVTVPSDAVAANVIPVLQAQEEKRGPR